MTVPVTATIPVIPVEVVPFHRTTELAGTERSSCLVVNVTPWTGGSFIRWMMGKYADIPFLPDPEHVKGTGRPVRDRPDLVVVEAHTKGYHVTSKYRKPG